MTSIRSVLGFDYGLSRIGIASGQTITKTATPVATLTTVRERPDWDRIGKQIHQWKPDALIVGVPYLADGGETDMTRAARNFARKLEHRYNLPVIEFDENYSSRAAEEQLKRARKISKHNKHEIDKMAAAIIVQGWLDTQ